MAHEMLRIYTVRLNLHTYTRGCSRIGGNLPSRGLKWENKTYKLKRSIVIISCNIHQDQSYLAFSLQIISVSLVTELISARDRSKHAVLSKINEVVVHFVRNPGWLLIQTRLRGSLIETEGLLSGVGLIWLSEDGGTVSYKKCKADKLKHKKLVFIKPRIRNKSEVPTCE